MSDRCSLGLCSLDIATAWMRRSCTSFVLWAAEEPCRRSRSSSAKAKTTTDTHYVRAVRLPAYPPRQENSTGEYVGLARERKFAAMLTVFRKCVCPYEPFADKPKLLYLVQGSGAPCGCHQRDMQKSCFSHLNEVVQGTRQRCVYASRIMIFSDANTMGQTHHPSQSAVACC